MDICAVIKMKRQNAGQTRERKNYGSSTEYKKIQKNNCRGGGCVSLVSVVYCQGKISVTGRSLVERIPTESRVSLCIIQNLKNEAALVPVGLLGRMKEYLKIL